jgi:hypothetical protein
MTGDGAFRDDGVFRDLGRLDGRVTAMESRMDRHESYMGEQLRGVGTQLSTMDVKLDAIAIAAAEARAEAGGQRRIVQVGLSVLAVLAAVAGVLATIGHFGIHF